MLFHRKNSVRFEDPFFLLSRGLTRLFSIWVSLTYPFESRGRNLSIHWTSSLPRESARRIKLGNSVLIHKDAQVHVRAPLKKEGEPVIIIDDRCVIEPRSTISARICIHLEHDVVVGPSVLIQDHTHGYEDVSLPIRKQGVTEGGRIRIGPGCWIGQGAVIHCGSGELKLGPNCIVAPKAFITRSFPQNSIISGNPARVIGQVDRTNGVWVLESDRALDVEYTKPRNHVTGVVGS